MICRDNYKDRNRFLDYLRDVKQVSAKTVKRARSQTRHLLEWQGPVPFPKAHTTHPPLPIYLKTARNDDRKEPLAPYTIQRICGTARRFFQFAIEEWPSRYRSISARWIETLNYKVRSQSTDEVKAYAIDQVRTLISLPFQTLTEQRDIAAVAFLFLSGARVGAFTTLPIKAIDLDTLSAKQWPSLGVETKGRKSATTFLLNIPDILDVVRAWDRLVRNELPPNALWYATLSRDGARFTGSTKAGKSRRSAVAKGLERLCERAGIPYLSPHSLRHGHAVFALSRATTIAAAKAVSQNLMHDSLTTTEKIYGKLTRDQVRREIAALTQLDQSTTDAPLEVITYGFSENPETLVEPLANAVIQRLPDAPSSFVKTLAEATAQCLLAKQNAGAP